MYQRESWRPPSGFSLPGGRWATGPAIRGQGRGGAPRGAEAQGSEVLLHPSLQLLGGRVTFLFPQPARFQISLASN